MKKAEIISILFELHKITGFRMSLHDINFNEIAAFPQHRMPLCALIQEAKGEYECCVNSDREALKKVYETKKPLIYKCRHGLVEAISPLYNYGSLTGFLIMGQICDSSVNKDALLEKLDDIGLERSRVTEILSQMPTVREDMTSSYLRIMTICAEYLTLSNALPKEKLSNAENAMIYIKENLDKKITIKDLCDRTGCSKTTLITEFKKTYGMTVNALITKERLSRAKELLHSDMSINEISAVTGFYDQSYFSKVFSEEFGYTPTEFRKEVLK